MKEELETKERVDALEAWVVEVETKPEGAAEAVTGLTEKVDAQLEMLKCINGELCKGRGEGEPALFASLECSSCKGYLSCGDLWCHSSRWWASTSCLGIWRDQAL